MKCNLLVVVLFLQIGAARSAIRLLQKGTPGVQEKDGKGFEARGKQGAEKNAGYKYPGAVKGSDASVNVIVKVGDVVPKIYSKEKKNGYLGLPISQPASVPTPSPSQTPVAAQVVVSEASLDQIETVSTPKQDVQEKNGRVSGGKEKQAVGKNTQVTTNAGAKVTAGDSVGNYQVVTGGDVVPKAIASYVNNNAPKGTTGDSQGTGSGNNKVVTGGGDVPRAKASHKKTNLNSAKTRAPSYVPTVTPVAGLNVAGATESLVVSSEENLSTPSGSLFASQLRKRTPSPTPVPTQVPTANAPAFSPVSQ